MSNPDFRDICAGMLHDFDDLVANSDGAAGLHRNGDVASWDSLTEGSDFAWTQQFARARAEPAKPQQVAAGGLPSDSVELADCMEAIAAETGIEWNADTGMYLCSVHDIEAIARAVLARYATHPAPVPVAPSDEEVFEAMSAKGERGANSKMLWLREDDFVATGRELLARYATHPAPQQEVPSKHLRCTVDSLREIAGSLVFMEKHSWALQLTAAAELLEGRHSHPAPVPVAEGLPGEGDWVQHCYAGVRVWQHGIHSDGRFFIGSGPESQPATHWALPLPEPQP